MKRWNGLVLIEKNNILFFGLGYMCGFMSLFLYQIYIVLKEDWLKKETKKDNKFRKELDKILAYYTFESDKAVEEIMGLIYEYYDEKMISNDKK